VEAVVDLAAMVETGAVAVEDMEVMVAGDM
jgi:hypothetical protein